MQHGQASSKTENPLRPLTARGIRAIEQVAQTAIQHNLPSISYIYHSGKLRAQQTAEVFAEHYHGSPTLSPSEGLQPNDDPTIWIQKLVKSPSADIMLIGHLPHLQKLAAILLGKDSIEFQNAGLVHLERNSKGKWNKKEILLPD